ncbi:uncharacterized protein SCHCODRAFT_02679816 [Schizophyllum commune H4-8]|nr:uncharacterized protein SCHCODRAFT_02679816 [Schizophyllum commune H4-8]KAI5889101.1 hypothetical protein SCHCODRAFT_02679816 [Schizophyllum commune H4-8]
MEKLQHIVQTTPLCSRCSHEFASVTGGPDLAALARSAYVPTTEFDRGSLQLGLANLEGGLSECEAEVTRVEEAARLLRLQKASLEETIADVKALLAPIRWMPPEVLGQIAAYTLPPRWFLDYIGGSVWSFSQVCHYWREITFGLCWAWQDFRVPYTAEGRQGEYLLELVDSYIQRSGQRPLRVGAFVRRPRETWEDIDGRVWQAIWANADRLKSLRFVRSIAADLRYPILPALTHLVVHGEPNAVLGTALPDNGRVPKLEALGFIEATIPTSSSFDWSVLRKLEVQNIMPRNIHVLTLCSNLAHLKLCFYARLHPSRVLGFGLLHFPSLETLCTASGAILLCPIIRAPRLACIELDVTYPGYQNDQRGGKHFVMDEEHLIGVYPHLLQDILKPVKRLILRNMWRYSVDTIYGIMSMANGLRDFRFIHEVTPITWNHPLHRELAEKLVFDVSRPTLTCLESVLIFNQFGLKGNFARLEYDLVRTIWQSRQSPLCSPLSSFQVLLPEVEGSDYPVVDILKFWESIEATRE